MACIACHFAAGTPTFSFCFLCYKIAIQSNADVAKKSALTILHVEVLLARCFIEVFSPEIIFTNRLISEYWLLFTLINDLLRVDS